LSEQLQKLREMNITKIKYPEICFRIYSITHTLNVLQKVEIPVCMLGCRARDGEEPLVKLKTQIVVPGKLPVILRTGTVVQRDICRSMVTATVKHCDFKGNAGIEPPLIWSFLLTLVTWCSILCTGVENTDA